MTKGPRTIHRRTAWRAFINSAFIVTTFGLASGCYTAYPNPLPKPPLSELSERCQMQAGWRLDDRDGDISTGQFEVPMTDPVNVVRAEIQVNGQVPLGGMWLNGQQIFGASGDPAEEHVATLQRRWVLPAELLETENTLVIKTEAQNVDGIVEVTLARCQ